MLNYDLVWRPPKKQQQQQQPQTTTTTNSKKQQQKTKQNKKLKSTTEKHRFMSLVTLTGVCLLVLNRITDNKFNS